MDITIYRDVCKSSGTLTVDQRNWKAFVNGVQVASSTSGTNNSVPTCSSTLSQNTSIATFTVASGDAIIIEWEDIYLEP